MSKEKKRSQGLKTSLLNRGQGTVSGGSVCVKCMKRATVGSLDSCVKAHSGPTRPGYASVTSGFPTVGRDP